MNRGIAVPRVPACGYRSCPVSPVQSKLSGHLYLALRQMTVPSGIDPFLHLLICFDFLRHTLSYSSGKRRNRQVVASGMVTLMSVTPNGVTAGAGNAVLTPTPGFHSCRYAKLSNRRPSPFRRWKMTDQDGSRQPVRRRRISPGLRVNDTSRILGARRVSSASWTAPL